MPKLPFFAPLRRHSVFILFVALLTGCAREGQKTAQVKGNVTLDDKPLSSGNVMTLPSAGRGAFGSIASDGSFELKTGTDTGALVGTHKVAVVAYASSGKSDPESGVGALLVPDRYTNPETSGLTIEVKPGEVNTPTLELTSP